MHKKWTELPIGCRIITPGNSLEFKTGNWSNKMPILDRSKCTSCLLCKLFCPENCIFLDAETKVSINYDYCKGCGICSSTCPIKAIIMEEKR